MTRARVFYGIRTDSYDRRYEYGTVDLGVACVAGDAAPVAARALWTEYEDTPHARKTDDAYRWHDGHLWEPVRLHARDTRWSHEVDRPDSYGFVRELSNLVWGRMPLTKHERDVASELNPFRPSERAWRRGPDLTGHEGAKDFLKLAREFLFVDGALYRRSMGPCLELVSSWKVRDKDPEGRPIRRAMILRSASSCHIGSSGPGSFPAEAHGEIDAIVSDMGYDVDPVREGVVRTAAELASGFVEMEHGLLAPGRTWTAAVLCAATAAAEGLGTNKLATVDRDALRHLLALRGALMEWSDEADAGARPGFYGLGSYAGVGWLAGGDLRRMEELLARFEDPALIASLPAKHAFQVSIMLKRMGLSPALEVDDQAIAGIAP